VSAAHSAEQIDGLVALLAEVLDGR
jgi:hypothetical protein